MAATPFYTVIFFTDLFENCIVTQFSVSSCTYQSVKCIQVMRVSLNSVATRMKTSLSHNNHAYRRYQLTQLKDSTKKYERLQRETKTK